ncbi:hypothetical protein ABPG73_005952 [Tetrahymena malaccensis]
MNNLEVAVLGGGCFWCIYAVFKRVRGVQKVLSGFSGGQLKNPTYKEVYTGTTGHAEVVQVTFDPEVISYENLLRIYFNVHDPTQLNRQNDEDVGTHYRSVIFYLSEQQQKTALDLIKELEESKYYKEPIVTQVDKFDEFYPAEDYHQNYFDINPEQRYCKAVVEPKLKKFLIKYKDYLKQEEEELKQKQIQQEQQQQQQQQ